MCTYVLCRLRLDPDEVGVIRIKDTLYIEVRLPHDLLYVIETLHGPERSTVHCAPARVVCALSFWCTGLQVGLLKQLMFMLHRASCSYETLAQVRGFARLAKSMHAHQ